MVIPITASFSLFYHCSMKYSSSFLYLLQNASNIGMIIIRPTLALFFCKHNNTLRKENNKWRKEDLHRDPTTSLWIEDHWMYLISWQTKRHNGRFLCVNCLDLSNNVNCHKRTHLALPYTCTPLVEHKK